MKNLYKKISILLAGVIVQNYATAQCTTSQTLGASGNMFGMILNGSHPVSADKSLNTIVFLHRNDAVTFGGNTGHLRFDVTTNGATTWTSNIGVINPANTNLARYPNAAIYNPTSNTNPANAYLLHFCPTVSGSSFVGDVSGVCKFDGTSITETYNQPGVVTGQIPRSLVKSTNNTFWTADPIFTPSIGYLLYKGVWSSSINDIVWTTSYTFAPSYYSGSPSGTEPSIAFDPTGMIGWFSFPAHVSTGPTNPGYYPVFYKTTDGGVTWNGPFQADLNKLSCITNSTSAGVPSTNNEHDLIVDVNGNPHFFTTVGSASSYAFNYSAWHHMYDITMKNGVWVAYDVGNVLGGQAVTTSTGGSAVQTQAPHAARTADGTKVFFTWTDNTSYSLGGANTSPNVYGKAFNVVNETWTPVKDFSSCNVDASGKVFFPHMAPEVLEPSSNTFKLAYMYTGYTVPGDLLSTINNIFLNNANFSTSEFTITTPPPPTPTITGVPIIGGTATVLYCPNSTVNINIGNAGQAIWSNGITTTSLAIINPTVNTYTVVAQVGCYAGTTSIIINTLNVNAAAISPSICPGSSASFSVTGNAYGYTWTPGGITGTNVTLNPTSNTVAVTASGDGCTSMNTVSITILPTPTLSIAGNNTICAGSVLTLTVSGANNYWWSDNSTNATFTIIPSSNTTYSVTGFAANTCTSSASVNVYIKPTPTVNAITTATGICAGQSATLMVTGATSYTWDGVPGNNTLPVSPVVTTVYTVSGTSSNGCIDSKTISITVYALPSITITPGRPSFCKGEKMSLTASGASTYTWVVPGALTPSILAQPTITTTYTVMGRSSEGCESTKLYTLTVSLCTSIAELKSGAEVSIYPNPNNGEFIISSDLNLEIKMINELGQTVRIIELNENNVYKTSVKELSPGIYFLTTGDEAFRQKIVVER
jgi:hypothetical protein